jgi:hypothetical protein
LAVTQRISSYVSTAIASPSIVSGGLDLAALGVLAFDTSPPDHRYTRAGPPFAGGGSGGFHRRG